MYGTGFKPALLCEFDNILDRHTFSGIHLVVRAKLSLNIFEIFYTKIQKIFFVCSSARFVREKA